MLGFGQICWGVSLEPPEHVNLNNEIVSQLSEVLEYMEGLVDYLMSKRREDARWVGILSVMLVLFFGLFVALIANLLADNFVTRFFVEHPGSNLIFLVFLSTFSIVTGVIAYFYAKKKYIKPYIPWRRTLSEVRKEVVKGEEKNILELALQLVDQASTWFLELVKYKDEEAFTYGLVAFFITALISAYSPIGLAISLLVGTCVWLYFRHEKREEAARQIRRFKALKKRIEKRKASFLEGINEGRA